MNKFILPGSMEIENDSVVAGIHTGPSEFEVQNLRYVEASTDDAQYDDTYLDLLGRVYDNSEGCLLKGTFRMKESPND